MTHTLTRRPEVDFVEERGGHIYGFEMKWTKRKTSAPKEWLTAYNASYQVISGADHLEFIT